MTIDKAELKDKLELYNKNKSLVLRNKIVVLMLPYVEAISKKISHKYSSNMNYDDVYQQACIGMIEAVTNIDADRIDAFMAYSYIKMHGSVVDKMRAESKFPRLAISRASMTNKIVSDFYADNGRNPTDHELADALGFSECKFMKWKSRGDLFLKTPSDEPGLEIEKEFDFSYDDLDVYRFMTKNLNSEERSVLDMFAIKNKSIKEIAQKEETTYFLVKKKFNSAINKIKVNSI